MKQDNLNFLLPPCKIPAIIKGTCRSSINIKNYERKYSNTLIVGENNAYHTPKNKRGSCKLLFILELIAKHTDERGIQKEH